MSKRFPWAKWSLPEVIDPPRVCYTIPVPDDPFHKAAFRGALLSLASATKWQDDPLHKARDVALVWREIYDLVTECEVHTEEGWNENLTSLCESLRFQNGKLQALCCGSWVTIDGQPSQGWASGPNGTGQAQPAGGGGCVDYKMSMSGNQTFMLPTVVSTGDTITITNMQGATYNPANSSWYLLNGDQFFGGFDVGYPVTNAGNPMAAIPSGSLIAKIGGTFYDIRSGTFTVPAGVSGQSVNFQVNYQTISTSYGDVQFTATVCNNATSTWTKDFDFTLSPYSFASYPIDGAAGGTWSAGTGWTFSDVKQLSSNEWFRRVNIGRAVTPTFEILSMDFRGNLTKGTYVTTADYGAACWSGPSGNTNIFVNKANNVLSNGSNQAFGPISHDYVAQGWLSAYLCCSTNLTSSAGLSGSCVITGLTVTGKGVQPTW